MPSLRDVAVDVDHQLPGTRCVFGTLRATLDDDDGEYLVQAMGRNAAMPLGLGA